LIKFINAVYININTIKIFKNIKIISNIIIKNKTTTLNFSQAKNKINNHQQKKLKKWNKKIKNKKIYRRMIKYFNLPIFQFNQTLKQNCLL
jgi:hypothetical protein